MYCIFPSAFAIIEINESRVAAETADQMESVFLKAVGEVRHGEIGVGHNVAGHPDESVAEVENTGEVPSDQRDATIGQGLWRGGLHGL